MKALLLLILLWAPLHARAELCAVDFALLDPSHWQEAAWQFAEKGDFAAARAVEEKIEHRLATGAVQGELVPATSGSSEVYRVKLEGGLEGMFKPSPKFWKHKRIRQFHEDRMPEKETAAYHLDRAVGGHIVPVTVMRTIDGKEGSLQVFVHLDEKPFRYAEQQSPLRNEQRLQVLDYIMGTHDRTPMNRPALEGSPVAIDNAMSFLKQSPHLSFGIQGPPRREEIEKLEKYGAALAGFKDLDLDKIRAALAGRLTQEEVDAALARATEIKALGEKAAGL